MKANLKSENKIVGIYIIVGITWILFSDTVVTHIFRDPTTIRLLSVAKGWLFIFITAVLLHILLRHHLTIISASELKVRKLNEDLSKRNFELEAANKELESFIYSLSHDLRAPLRAISSFTTFLLKDYGRIVDDKGKDYLSRIDRGAAKMNILIEDLLRLSTVSTQQMSTIVIDLSSLAGNIVSDLSTADPLRKIEISISKGLSAVADPHLMRIALLNLMENAWKFTSKTEAPHIEFGATNQDGKAVYYVRDNGVGFDRKQAAKMFKPFHRLHTAEEFEGTGIGLAIVERIIRRHGGTVWSEGEMGKGSTIFFTLS